MSSKGNSSARVFSGAAFAPMSSDPLSREVSEPNTSSTESVPEVASPPEDRGAMESVPEVASRPEDRGDIEPAREAAPISGRQGNEKVEEVLVSCGNL